MSSQAQDPIKDAAMAILRQVTERFTTVNLPFDTLSPTWLDEDLQESLAKLVQAWSVFLAIADGFDRQLALASRLRQDDNSIAAAIIAALQNPPWQGEEEDGEEMFDEESAPEERQPLATTLRKKGPGTDYLNMLEQLRNLSTLIGPD